MADCFRVNSLTASEDLVAEVDAELTGDACASMSASDLSRILFTAAKLGWELSEEALDMVDLRLRVRGGHAGQTLWRPLPV